MMEIKIGDQVRDTKTGCVWTVDWTGLAIIRIINAWGTMTHMSREHVDAILKSGVAELVAA